MAERHFVFPCSENRTNPFRVLRGQQQTNSKPDSMIKVEYRCLVRVAILLLTIAAVIGVAGEASACPTCKDGLAENDPSTQAMAAGYFYSILFMMSMPFLIIATFGSFAYYSVRKAQSAQEAQQLGSVTQ